MKKAFSILIIGLVCIGTAFAKDMPDNMEIDSEGKLVLKYRNFEGLYDINELRTIYLEFEQSNYWSQMLANYESGEDIPARLTMEGNTIDGVGVRFRGQTSYMKVQGEKKSFNISIDFSDEDARLMGYKTLNLNNGYEDASFMREALYAQLAGQHIPTARVNWVRLVINGENWGIYNNVQQLNKDFFEEWFQSNEGGRWRGEAPDTVQRQPGSGGGGGGMNNRFGAGTSSLNYLGDDYMVYTSNYTIKSDDDIESWEKLVTACRMLGTLDTDLLYDSLKYYLDVDRSLWHIANEIIYTDEDGYVNKGGMDYYVYWDDETDRVTPIDFDANSTFMSRSTNMSIYKRADDDDFPLVNILLANPELKQRYLAHIRTILSKDLTEDNTNEFIDMYKTIIESTVIEDDKKLYSDNEFYSTVEELKTFVKNRRAYLLNLPALNVDAPEISGLKLISESGEVPGAMEEATITVDINSINGISKVMLYFSTGFEGAFERTEMYDDGNHGDGDSGDGIFGADIPGFTAGTYVRYYIEARADNISNTSSFYPEGAEHDVFIYQVKANITEGFPVVINEVMASNDNTIADPQGEYDDWIELFNTGNEDIDLSGLYLSDKTDNLPKWQFPENTVIGAGEYLIVWADEDGKDSPGLHANFKLSASGELLMLVDTDENGNAILDSLNYDSQETDVSLGRYPNGSGDFAFMQASPGEYNDNTSSVNDYINSENLSIYPNPFSDNSNIEFETDDPNSTSLTIFNSSGQIIRQFGSGFNYGRNVIKWSGTDDNSLSVSSGVYYIRLICGAKISHETIVYIGTE